MKSTQPARCVLTFHRIVNTLERDHDVSWASFLRILETIKEEITTELRLRPDTGRGVVLTFDDGSHDHAAVGRALAERQVSGIFFVPAGKIGSGGFLNEDELRELHAEGHIIGSHGFRNISLNGLAPSELRQELRDSKERLQNLLGTAIGYLSPPGGSNHPLLVKELEESGFSAARSMRWGVHRTEADRWRIPCIPVTELTISRGWVERVLARWRLPVAMRAVWEVKELLPADTRSAVRSWSHRISRE